MAWNARPEEAYSVGAIRQSDVRKRIRKGSILLMLALLTAFITRSRIPLTSLQQGNWTEALLWASVGAFGYIVSVYFALAGLRSFIPPIQKPKSDWDKKLSDKQRTLWGFPRPKGQSKGQAPLSAVSQPAAKTPAPLGPPARNAKPITAATPTGETGVLDQSPFTPQSTGSDKARASSPYSSVPAVTTPEQLQHYLDAFEERMGMSGGAGPQGTEGHQTADLGLGRNPVAAQLLMASQGGPTYRPSLQARGTAGSPLRGGDGRLAPSSQETVESVLARLRVDRRTLEVWTDRLREWLAAHVIQPLLRCVDSAHRAVSEAAGQLGWSGLALSPLGEPEASGGSRRLDADDEALLIQLREALNRYLGDPAQAAQRQKVISCLEAVLQYQRLAALLRGDHPRGLLPPVPRGYIAFRLRDLAVGSCVGQFMWNSGGAWLGKPWSPELLTDSALVFYLFAAFLEAPRWFFPLEEVQQGVSTAVPLYIGSLPSRPAEQCTALLPVRPATLPSGATAILALGLALVPNFTLVLKGEPVLTLSNNTAVLQVILLMLQATKLSGRADIGGHSLDHLRLTSVLRPADRVHSLFVGKWFGVW